MVEDAILKIVGYMGVIATTGGLLYQAVDRILEARKERRNPPFIIYQRNGNDHPQRAQKSLHKKAYPLKGD